MFTHEMKFKWNSEFNFNRKLKFSQLGKFQQNFHFSHTKNNTEEKLNFSAPKLHFHFHFSLCPNSLFPLCQFALRSSAYFKLQLTVQTKTYRQNRMGISPIFPVFSHFNSLFSNCFRLNWNIYKRETEFSWKIHQFLFTDICGRVAAR